MAQTPSQRRAKRLEAATAARIGSRRVATIGSYKSEPDVAPILVAGERVAVECKVRLRAPRVLTRGMDQALSYCPGALPMVVIREHSGDALACMRLDDLCRLLGIQGTELPTKNRPIPRDPRQCELFQ